MENTLSCLVQAIADILADNTPGVCLYGSCVLDDFHPGWSDIDLLVLTPQPFTADQANLLLHLRQTLPVLYPTLTYARACEGCIAPLDTLTISTSDSVVYWGTSGQRLTDRPALDAFALWQLHHQGRVLHGPDMRHFLPLPTSDNLHKAIARHLRTILDHGRGSRSIYSFGWLLDIARGLYTLHHDAVIAKTAAGEWVLENGLCPNESALRLALDVRRTPALMQQSAVQQAAEALTPAIQSFAVVLRQELEARGIPIPD